MSRRRFALVSPNYYPRTCGVGDHSMRLAQELRRRGHEAAIFTRSPAQSNPEAPDVPVVGVSGASPLLLATRIGNALREYSPTDVILQYTPQMFGASRWGSPATLVLAGWMRRRHIPVTVLAHELFFSWSRRPDLIVGASLMRLQLSALMRLTDRILVTVEARARQVRSLARLTGARSPVGVVRVGAGALPVARPPRTNGLRLGTFSTLGRDKRFDVVLDCFARVHESDPGAELVLLGDLASSGDAQVERLRERITRHPAAARIRLPGKQSLAEIAEEVAALDVYLFPMSTGANTRSSTLPLALGTGVPVVAVRGPETDDLFVADDNIVFAESLTGDAFGRAALRLARAPELAERVARGAKALYEDHLSWIRIGDQLLAAAS